MAEIETRYLECIIRTEERVKGIDEKMDSITLTLRDHDSRLRRLESNNAQKVGAQDFQQMSLRKLALVVSAISGGAGGLGGLLVWILGGG